jgi:hypothetical protein
MFCDDDDDLLIENINATVIIRKALLHGSEEISLEMHVEKI